MKIIVFGATGDVGRKVVAEALSRQHHVTAVGRSEAKLAELPAGTQTIVADLTTGSQRVANMVADFDLVISALRPDAGHEQMMVGLTRTVLSAAKDEGLPIIITGGAARLKLADGSEHTVLSAPDYLPESVRPIAQACADQDVLLDMFPDVEWTCLRPPAMLLNDDTTGRYRFGTDTLVTNDAGESRISYADFAAAILDVAENRDGFDARITVAWRD